MANFISQFKPFFSRQYLRTNIYFRSLLFLILLGIEAVTLSLLFDTSHLPIYSSSIIIKIIGLSGVLLKLIFAFFSFYFLTVCLRFQYISNIMEPFSTNNRWFTWFISHLIMMSLFIGISNILFSADSPKQWENYIGFLWGSIGLTAVINILLAIAPVTCWYQYFKQEFSFIVTSLIVAIIAWKFGGILAYSMESTLTDYTFQVSHYLLSWVYPDTTANAVDKLIGTPSFTARISPQCSGYEGIGLISVFFSVYLWLFRKELRFPHVFLLFPIGIVSIWILNAVRIMALIVIGSSISPQIAIGGFHSNAGWISFILISALLTFIVQHISYFKKAKRCSTRSRKNNLAVAMISPFVALLSIILITTTFTSGFDWLYPLRVIAVVWVLWCFRNSYTHLYKHITRSSIITGAFVFFIWLSLIENSDTHNQVFSSALSEGSTITSCLWLFFRSFGASLTVPIVEELAFRGYLINKLSKQDFTNPAPIQFNGWAFIVSSILFGVMHSDWFAGIIAGMAYAYALYQRGQVFDAVIAHITTNALLTGYVLITGYWSLW